MCQACQVVRINGVRCHEIGCPESWRDQHRECRNCGSEFVPEERGQRFCDESCYADFHGLPAPDGAELIGYDD